VLTAPVDYLGSITKGQQNAVKTVDTTSPEPGDPVVQLARAQPERPERTGEGEIYPADTHAALWDEA